MRFAVSILALVLAVLPAVPARAQSYPTREIEFVVSFPPGGPADSAARNPMRRIGAMSELQNLATFLMADGCDWLTGETIAVDGAGWLATGGNFAELDRLSDADWERMRALIKAQNDKDRAGRSA